MHQPYLPPVPCESWCTYQDDRVDKWHRDDQYCCSELARTDLTLEADVPESRYSSKLGEWLAGPDYVEVYLLTGVVAAPEVRMMRAELSEVRFTLDEARQLRDHLDALLALATAEVAR